MTKPDIQDYRLPRPPEACRESGEESGKTPPSGRANPAPPFGTEPRREDVLKALRGRL
jgi:hypothetical protein